MIWTPHVTVATVIEVEKRFLLVEEKAEGVIVFNQPAGHVDPGEDLLTAAIREALEETAWQVELESIIGLYQYANVSNNVTYLRICFCGHPLRHEPERPLDKGILQAVWLTREEVANRSNLRSPMVLRCIDDYLAGQRYPLTLITHL